MPKPQSAGGRARARALGPRQRSEIARRAALARWSVERRGKVSMSTLRALATKLIDSAAGPATVYLFGSYARGDATANSDIDILVVERGLRDWLTETVRLRRVVRAGLDKEVDLIVMGARDWQKWRKHEGTVQHAAATEGVRLGG
jgi:predicted nucleotidyltransferase